MPLEPDVAYATKSIKIDTPDGLMFVHIIENKDGRPFQILINIGKAGTNLAAWADAVARLVTRLLAAKMNVTEVMEEISGITSSQLKRLKSGEIIRSGPEGLAVALFKYTAEWHRDNRPKPRRGGSSIDPR